MVMQENVFVVRRYTLKNLGLKDYCVCNLLSNISSIIIVAMIREVNKADTGKTLMTVVSE